MVIMALKITGTLIFPFVKFMFFLVIKEFKESFQSFWTRPKRM